MKQAPWILALAFCLAGCGGGDSQTASTSAPADGQAPIEIRFAHAHAPDASAELHFIATAFADALSSESSRFAVKIHPKESLGSEREVYEGMQIGSGATCAVSGTAILNNFDQRVGVVDLPYLWRDYDHVHRALDGEVGATLAADLEKQGFVVLAWFDSFGWRNIVTRDKEVRTPADLQGLKIRTIQTPTYIAAIKMLGANPTPMSYGEVYTGLQTGVVDGFEQASAIIVADRFYEVTRHIALTRHLFGPLVLCYSKPLWDRLSPEDQAAIRRAAAKAQSLERARAPIREAEATQFLRDKGLTFNEIDTARFQQDAVALQDQIAAERGATDLLQNIRAAAQ